MHTQLELGHNTANGTFQRWQKKGIFRMLYVMKEVIKKFAWVLRISGGWSLKLGNLLWAGCHQSRSHFCYHKKLLTPPEMHWIALLQPNNNQVLFNKHCKTSKIHNLPISKLYWLHLTSSSPHIWYTFIVCLSFTQFAKGHNFSVLFIIKQDCDRLWSFHEVDRHAHSVKPTKTKCKALLN